MTHSLHRRGPLEALKDDYVLVAMTSRMNREVTRPALSRVAEIMFEAGLCNTGSVALETNVPIGFDRHEFIERISTASILQCSFSSKAKLREALAKLREADLGISITVSGVIDEVIPLAQELGLKPHTISLSLGIIGKTEELPEEEILEFTTMCGHALIGKSLARKGVQDVACGAKTPHEASVMIGKPCICGIYNLDRSGQLLAQKAVDK